MRQGSSSGMETPTLRQRHVAPEKLDDLAVDDPGACASRGDLRRLNCLMGHARLLAKTLGPCLGARRPRVVELGAGDGTLMLKVTRKLGRKAGGMRVDLVDRLPAVSMETRRGFEEQKVILELQLLDVFDWLKEVRDFRPDCIVANLFLHHFEDDQLAGLFQAVARETPMFIAIEPRRSQFCLMISRMLAVIGCNEITRHDAPISVRAGFRDQELGQLWPREGGWALTERRAGMCSHLFVARSMGKA